MNRSDYKPWTRDELILAINLYCSIPFGTIHVRNPKVIELASLIGRTPGSVSYKLANFASIDPSLARRGAANVSKLDKEVWYEFFENWDEMIFESIRKTADSRNTVPDVADIENLPEGKTRDAVVRIRVNQEYFRRMILASYDGACCITGLCVPELLVACHIVPWSVDIRNRMNPQNGLCLNALHDRAFDAGLITVDELYRVVVSPRIRSMDARKSAMVRDFEGAQLRMPSRFLPDQELLAFHRENVFVE